MIKFELSISNASNNKEIFLHKNISLFKGHLQINVSTSNSIFLFELDLAKESLKLGFWGIEVQILIIRLVHGLPSHVSAAINRLKNSSGV